jgi:hypothetical protein
MANTLAKRNRYTVPETEAGKCSWTLDPFGILSMLDIIKHSARRVVVIAMILCDPPGCSTEIPPRTQPFNALIYMNRPGSADEAW